MPDLINLTNKDLEREYSLEGYDAYDADGNKLGSIAGVIVEGEALTPRYVVVDAGGWFSTKEFVVPAGDIRTIDDDKQRVSFTTLTKELLQSGRYPRYDQAWWDRNDHAGFREYERGVAAAYRPERRGSADTAEVDYNDALYQRPAQGAQRLQLLEERLRVGKERERAGEVRLGKRIVERTETVNVPVREERVVIERRAVNEPARGAVDFKEETIEVPVARERAVVDKDTVVTEEVGVRREASERTQQVQGTVRKEELVVEGDEGLVEHSEHPNAPRTAQHERERTRRG